MWGGQVEAIFNLTEHNFPGAEVVASTLDAYVEALHRALPRLKLPVVTQEIGDTWVYGAHPSPSPLCTCMCM